MSANRLDEELNTDLSHDTSPLGECDVRRDLSVMNLILNLSSSRARVPGFIRHIASSSSRSAFEGLGLLLMPRDSPPHCLFRPLSPSLSQLWLSFVSLLVGDVAIVVISVRYDEN